ncbi:hypothetical protein HJC23_013298 [Cyclotella cryptica]|uniref:Kinesin light chain n=1 Tax=Cyclotella cryptica TaxID=29204 RepID=A0ABD3PAR9_9STRA|eukprot:CCRYP_016115-RA/>CCRYP_016115-RA protein AED:0.23 eAED:0.23 QI:0/-1/0/1/-1/1/1/0/268
MVRRSFSNPVLRVLASRRRDKNDKKVDEDLSNRRKESIDQTVLSGDDSRFNRSVASFSDGFVVEPIDAVKPSGAQVAAAPPLTPLRRASKSDPTFRSQGPLAETCHCSECTSSQERIPRRTSAEFATDWNGGRFDVPAMPYMQPSSYISRHETNQRDFLHNLNFDHDRALQARIEAVEIQQRLLGENHPDVIFALSSLAKLCQKRGDFEGASSILRESQVRSLRAKTWANEQQVSRIQLFLQPEDHLSSERVHVPSEISVSFQSSLNR